MKKFAIVFLVVLCALGLAALAFSASATPPKGKITVSVSGARPATFDHDAHVKNVGDCQKCHHKDPAGKGSKCTACHTTTGKDGAPPGKDAFHKKCGDCHKAQGKGPLVTKDCKVCHGG